MAEGSGNPADVSPPWQRALRYGGYGVMGLAGVYLVAALARTDFADAFAALSPAVAMLVMALSLVYLGLLVLLAQAWVITAAGTRQVAWLLAVRVYGIGVVAKYVPGSIFQYASRQILGAREGWAQAAMLRASLAEAALHCACAALAGTAMALGGGTLGGVVAGLVGGAVALSAQRPLLRAAGLQLCAFAGLALCVQWLAAGILSVPASPLLVGAFMAAWIAGFLVPAAPGGLGVRETTFLLLADGFAPSGELAVLAILVRAVTTFGDAGFGILAYGLSLGVRRKQQASA